MTAAPSRQDDDLVVPWMDIWSDTSPFRGDSSISHWDNARVTHRVRLNVGYEIGTIESLSPSSFARAGDYYAPIADGRSFPLGR